MKYQKHFRQVTRCLTASNNKYNNNKTIKASLQAIRWIEKHANDAIR